MRRSSWCSRPLDTAGGAAGPRRGLTAREADVPGLLALGLATRQVARLVISPRTAQHHVQPIYTKIGASTRGAAALFATVHGLVGR